MAKKKEDYIQKIAIKLKQMRIEAGYSSYENFANAKDIDRKQYWRIENGSNITISTLVKILKLHKISLNDFFQDFD
jgi:transcriptional regulator with XRE-family HTH domain